MLQNNHSFKKRQKNIGLISKRQFYRRVEAEKRNIQSQQVSKVLNQVSNFLKKPIIVEHSNKSKN